MPKAQVTLPDGTIIKLDGTAEEISSMLEKIKKKRPQGAKTLDEEKTEGPKQLIDLIESLISDNYFRTPRDLGSIKSVLAEMGHHYPVTTLSGAMLRQVRKRNLRRLKKDNRWYYTGTVQ